MSEKSLAALAQQTDREMEEIMAADGEITPEQEATLFNEKWKVDRNIMFLHKIEAERSRVKDVIADLQAYVKQLNSREDYMLAVAHRIMSDRGVTDLDGVSLKFTLQKNPPGVTVVDESLVDETYWIQPPPPPRAIDKRRILTEWKMGVPVPGVEVTQGTRVVTKTNTILTKSKKAKAAELESGAEA